ncbi:MAG: membrane protein insertase YidC [candidate division WOR-3 bacterium]
MNRNFTLILFLLLFFIIYNILLLKLLPKEKKEELKEKVTKTELKSLNLKESGSFIIENENLKIVFSEKGGIIKEIILKKYRDLISKENVKINFYNFVSPFDSILEIKEITNNKISFSSPDGKVSKEFILEKGYKLKSKFINTNYFLFSTLPLIDKGDEKIYHYIEYSKGKVKRHNYNNFLNIDFAGENTLWIGSETKYFVQVLIKPEYYKKIIKGEEYKEGKFFKLINENRDSFITYIGPKDYFVLKKEGFLLHELYPMGFFIVKPFTIFILYSFNFLYDITKHFSLVILIFTLLMKIIFIPLTIKSLRAMKKMEELKPRMDALKKAYKDDPKKLNEEILKLYKEMGVNPFSGCLPLLLQLPVFWALYQVLTNEIMFRGSELFLWIKDLSSKDPYYVLPVLMGLTSLLQQIIQPSQDKDTKRIGLFMSVFITIIFLNFPAGLVYYWLLYNIIGLFETMLIKKRFKK